MDTVVIDGPFFLVEGSKGQINGGIDHFKFKQVISFVKFRKRISNLKDFFSIDKILASFFFFFLWILTFWRFFNLLQDGVCKLFADLAEFRIFSLSLFLFWIRKLETILIHFFRKIKVNSGIFFRWKLRNARICGNTFTSRWM